eukprot:140997-Rhodomonas_salina.1
MPSAPSSSNSSQVSTTLPNRLHVFTNTPKSVVGCKGCVLSNGVVVAGQVTEDAAWREAEEERRAAELGGGGGVRFGMGGEEEEQMD